MTVRVRNRAERRSPRGRLFLAAGLVLLLLAGDAALTGPAAAGGTVAPREQLVEILRETYGETQAAIGIDDSGSVIELFTAGNGASWTLLLTMPDGMSLVVATGEGWSPAEPSDSPRPRGRPAFRRVCPGGRLMNSPPRQREAGYVPASRKACPV